MALEGDAKFEEKLTRSLENNMRNLAKFLPEHLKVQTQIRDFYEVLLSQAENVRA